MTGVRRGATGYPGWPVKWLCVYCAVSFGTSCWLLHEPYVTLQTVSVKH